MSVKLDFQAQKWEFPVTFVSWIFFAFSSQLLKKVKTVLSRLGSTKHWNQARFSPSALPQNTTKEGKPICPHMFIKRRQRPTCLEVDLS